MLVKCIKCNSFATIPIVHGKPVPEMHEAGNLGVVYLAGCVTDDQGLNRKCKSCGFEWKASIPFIDNKKAYDLVEKLRLNLGDKRQLMEEHFIKLGRECRASKKSAIDQFVVFETGICLWDFFTINLLATIQGSHADDPNSFIDRQRLSCLLTDLLKFKINYFDRTWWLARDCFSLGVAMQKNNVQEIADLSALILQNRHFFDDFFKSIEDLVLTY